MSARRVPARWPLLALVLALAGCGNAPQLQTGFDASVSTAASLLRDRRAAPEAAPLRPTAGFPGLDPALIAGRSDPMMGAYLESRQAVAGLQPVGRNPPHTTWQTADGIALTLLDGGLVAATRGLGADLHGADLGPSAALVSAGRAGQATRRHVHLDGLYRASSRRYACTVQPVGPEVLVLNGQRRPTLRIEERCQGEGDSFTNIYWRDARGSLIRQSSQWLGPELGMVHLQRLID